MADRPPLLFRRPTPSANSTNSVALSTAPSFNSDQQQQIRGMLDQLQVLYLTKPRVAAWWTDWNQQFLDHHSEHSSESLGSG